MDKETEHEKLQKAVTFLVEADKLKSVLRQTHTIGGARRENSAEHSWHIALMALVLHETANEPIDLLRTLKMLLLHDLVEIDAGDTFVYDSVAVATKAAREEKAAERIFGLLPAETAAQFHALWAEFEAGETPEARFAAAVDRIGGMLPNYHNKGGTWRAKSISPARIKARNRPLENGSARLWAWAEALIDDAQAQGWIHPDTDAPPEKM